MYLYVERLIGYSNKIKLQCSDTRQLLEIRAVQHQWEMSQLIQITCGGTHTRSLVSYKCELPLQRRSTCVQHMATSFMCLQFLLPYI